MQPSNGRQQASDRMTGSNPMSPGSSGDVSPFDLSGDMGDTAPGSPVSDAADGSLQDSLSGQKWDSNAEMAEQAKHEADIENRIAELRKEGFWTPRRLAKVPEPSRPKVHWDYLCEEMQWLSADFGQERRWKRGVARKVVRMVVRHHEDLKQKEERARREEQAKLRRIATSIAKEVRQFWSNVEKVVQFKQQSRLEEKRKKALDLQLDFIVGQTEKYSDLLSQSLSETRPASKTSSSCIGSSRGTSPAPSLSVRGDEDFFPHEEEDEEEDDEETIDMEERQDGHDAESHRLEIEMLKRESEVPIEELLQSLRPEIVQKPVPNHWMQEAEEDDDEFTANEDDAEDEEETIAAEEELEEQPDHKEELNVLTKEGEMSLEELLKKYSELQHENHSLEDGEENELSDQGTGSSDYGSSDSEGVEYLLKPKDESETPQHSEPKKEITDIAATAESLQPKGYTLATTQVKTTVPFLLRGELREYQHIGLEWMVTMYEKKLNGILADEMGLGKTIQTISLLAHLACDKEDWGPHLIIVPTSVILNWEMELKRWCPSFKILTYYGSQKERRLKRQGWTKVNAFHVCITSYKLVLQDHQAFRRKNWKYLILDEAQNIKNFKSQRWQSLLNFNSQRRLLLTGTPLQNSLMELWSLMHFLMPHVFQSHREFKEWFSNPLTGMIEGSQEYNEGLVRRLHKVLRPFLLRRIKVDVEKQMPKKYEHVIYCRLSKRQRFLYDDFMSQATTRDTLASGHFMSVINILMQLRKVCNHPNLFDPRPIHSPFITSAICYSVPSLVLHALQHHPLQCADMAKFDLINMENRTSRYESEVFLPRYKPSHSLIQEIADSPEPPPRPRPLKMKVNRMLQPVTKPDPRTLVVVNNSRHVQKPADPPLLPLPPPVPAGPPAQAPPNPVYPGVVGSMQQTVQTQVPPVVQSAPGMGSIAPSTMGTLKPVAAPTAQPGNSTPQRLILSPDMQARLPSGEVITLSQLASLGRPLQAPAVTKPLTVQLHGAKLTLGGPQIRQLTMGQARPLQGNVLHLVSSGGQHHLLSQPAQLALIQALAQQAASPAPSATVQNSIQAQLGVQTVSLQSVPHALLAGANLPATAVTGQAPGVVKIVVRQAARETPAPSPRPPQAPPLHLPQNSPRPLLRVLPGSLPENGTSRTGLVDRAVTAVTTSSISTSPLLMVSSPKPPAPNPIGSLQNHNVAFNTEAPSAVPGVALRLLTSGTSATLQLTNHHHHHSSQPRPTQSPALTSSPAHSLASTGSALGQIPGLANRTPCQGVTSDSNTCAIPQKVSATDTNLNQSVGQVSYPLSNGNGFGQTAVFLPQNSTVQDHLDSVISQTPPAPLSCLSSPVPTSEHTHLLSLNSSPASPNATPGLPKLAPSGYNFSLVPALLTNSSPCTVSSYNPVPARFLTSSVSLLTLAPLPSTNSNTAPILYTHPNTLSTLGVSATASQTIPLPTVQSSATLPPQSLAQPPLPASVTLASASVSLPSTSTPPGNALSALTSCSPAGPAASTASIMLASASAPFSSITLATPTPVATAALTTPTSTIVLAPASTSTTLTSVAMPTTGHAVAAIDAPLAASLIPVAGSPAPASRSILAAPTSDSFTTLVAPTSAHRPLRTAPASASLPLAVIASPTPAPVAALAALTPTVDTSLATLGAPVSAPLAVLASPAPLQTLSGSISVPYSLLAASVSETLPSLVLSTQLPLVTTSVTEPAPSSSSSATLLPSIAAQASPLPLITASDNIPLPSSVTLPLLSTSVPVLAAKSTFITSPVSQTTVTASPVPQTTGTASPVPQTTVTASPVPQTAVAASPFAQAVVTASPVPQTAVAASVAQTAVAASPVAQTVVAASPVAQAVVAASPVAQAVVAASPVAQAVVAASPVAQAVVAASPVAQAVVAASPVAQAVVAASPVAQAAVVASVPVPQAAATLPFPVPQVAAPLPFPVPQVAAPLPFPVPQAAATLPSLPVLQAATSAPFPISLAVAPLLAGPQAAAISLPAPQAVSLPGPTAMASALLSTPTEAAAPLTIPHAVAAATPCPVPQAVAAAVSQYTAQAMVPPLSAPPLLQSVSLHCLASSSVTASSCTAWAAAHLPSPAASASVSSISMHQPIHASAPPPLQASSEQISLPLLPSPSSSLRTTFAIPVTKPPITSAASASCSDAPSPALQLSCNTAAASAPVSSLSFCIASSVSTTLSNVTAPLCDSPQPLAASCAPMSAAEPTLSLSVASPSSVSVTLNTTMESDMLLDGDLSRSIHTTGGSASVWPRRQLPPPPRSPFYLEPLEERRRRHKVERLERIFQLNEQRCGLTPVYGAEILRFCSLPNKPVLLADPCSLPRHLHDYWLQTSGLTNCVFTPQQRLEQLAPLIERFIFAMPPVEAPRITLHTSHPPPSLLLQESLFKETLSRDLMPRTSCLHRIISNMRTQFPDLRLIQYDCGKLQTLDRLLRGLKSGGHRVLLFTQMTRMLDILEQFLNYHGHIYLRLDGSTRVEQRQVLMERFNMDKRIFCFILSTRSGGVGVNLTGADTVIFYDSDWNPTMDAQAQDRCHRIGQTRDVHIYRLVSDRTVEENILKKAQQKRMLGDMAIEGGNFTTAYFKQQTIRELFDMEDVSRRDTETRPASPDRSTEDGSSGRHTNILEQALCGAEDEEDTLAASLVRAEQVADLAEFNENAPLEQEEEEPSRAEQEISALVEQLTPIERYAMYYLEASMEDVSREELKQAEEQVEAARKDLFLAKDDGQSAEERWEEECRKIRKSRAPPPARSQGERPPVRMSERLRGGRATEGTDVGRPAEPETTAPVPQADSLAEETHSLETVRPAEETVASGHENVSSAEETDAPVQETVSPAVQTDTPVTETRSPVVESVTPVQDTAVPGEETVTPGPKKVQDTARSLVDQNLTPKTDLPEPDPMVKSEDDSRVLEEYSSSPPVPPACPQQEVLEHQGFLNMEECKGEVVKEEEKLIVSKQESSLSCLSACASQEEESSAPRTPRRKVTADSEILLAGAADGSPTAKVLRRLPGRLVTVVQDRPPVHRRSRGRGPRPLVEQGALCPHTSEPQSPTQGLLSDENSDAGSPPPKRKRGRPPKTRAEQSPTGVSHDLSQVVSSPELSNSPTGARMPGSPSPSSRLNSESESGSPTEKRKRGRPPKQRESAVTASPSVHPPSDTTEDNLPSHTSDRLGVKVDPDPVVPACDPAADPVIPSVASDIPRVGVCKEGAGSSSGVDDLASPPKRKRGRPPKSQAMSKNLSSPSLHNERPESSPERSSSPQTTRTPFRRKKPSKSVTLEEQRRSSRPPDTDDSSGGEDVPVRTPFTRSARTRLHPDQAPPPPDTTPASIVASKLPRGRSLRAAPVSEKPSGTKRKPVSISSPSPPSSPHASSSERQVSGGRKRLCPPAERILRSSLTANPASNTRSSRPVPPLPNSPNSHRGRKAKT